MKVTCPICHTEKTIKDEKLLPFRGKTISTKCANKNCSHRIKFKVPADFGMEQTKEENESIEKNQEQITKDKQDVIYCPECKSPVKADLSFCPKCGAKLNPSKITQNPSIETEEYKQTVHYCKNCQAILPENAKFCLQCGTPVSESKTAINLKKKEESTSTNTPIPKETKTIPPQKNTSNKTVNPPINKQKKGGCLKTIVIILVILIILGILTVVGGYIWYMQQENVLADGPWTTETHIQKKLFTKTRHSNIKQWNQAARKVNAAYKAYLDSTSVHCPAKLPYKKGDGTYFLNQFHPVKKNNLYFFTITEPDNEAKMNVVLELKTKDYFEAKAFFVSKNQIVESYIKGHLKE